MASYLGRRKFLATLGGAAATWPLAAHAQQPAMPVIGFLRSTPDIGFAYIVDPFRQGLNDAGFVGLWMRPGWPLAPMKFGVPSDSGGTKKMPRLSLGRAGAKHSLGGARLVRPRLAAYTCWLTGTLHG